MPNSPTDANEARNLLPVDWSLLPPGQRILVAVSGGADSMALLLALKHGGCDLIVAHINHGLRGSESDDDEAFIQQHCAKFDIPCVMERVTIPSRDGHVNEAAARIARYESLTELAQAHSCSRIATGHTATDLLETVLINWLRGAAVVGLQGIRPERHLTEQVLLVRPLLRATRAQVRAACQQAVWSWREDSSNADLRYLRNRVRHELLPAFESILGAEASLDRLAQRTARACEVLRSESDYLDEVTQEHLAALTLQQTDTLIALDGLRFRTLPVALQRRIMRAVVQRLQGEVRDLSLESIEAARHHVLADGRRMVWQWRRGINVEWTGAMAGNRIRIWLVSDFSTRNDT